MSLKRTLLIAALALAYAVFWIGGVVSYLFLGGPPPGSAWTAPVFLYTAALLTLALAPRPARLTLLAVGALGLAAEICGVHTGIPFGPYRYTQALGPMALRVPWTLGCAWMILFAYVKQVLVLTHARATWRSAPLGAGWMVALDLLIDPLAAGPLGYWIWLRAGLYYHVPAQNFAGWFLVSLILFLAFPCPWTLQPGLAALGLSLVLFFTLIALGHGLLGPALAGAGLILLHAWLLWRRRRKAVDHANARL